MPSCHLVRFDRPLMTSRPLLPPHDTSFSVPPQESTPHSCNSDRNTSFRDQRRRLMTKPPQESTPRSCNRDRNRSFRDQSQTPRTDGSLSFSMLILGIWNVVSMTKPPQESTPRSCNRDRNRSFRGQSQTLRTRNSLSIFLLLLGI